MPERKKLSQDVMKEFLKNPDAVVEDPPAPAARHQQPSAKEPSDLTASVLAEFKSGKSEPRVRMTVDLIKSRHKRLKAVAQDLETDMSTLVRTLIDKFLDEIDNQ